MGSTYQRSFLKGFSWEFISFVITFIIVYIAYGDFSNSLLFSLILSLIKIGFFFLHERFWKTIRWGKVKDTKN
jgi:adenylylsulfate kinase